MTQTIIPYPQGIWRAIFRLPLQLHRVGLGWMLRPLPFLILTTQGRASGLPRHTVLEYRRHGSQLYVVSGWGMRPHWIQNLQANPVVTVQIGTTERKAIAHVVDDPAEPLRALYMFQRTSKLAGALFGAMSNATTIDLRSLKQVSNEFTVVRLDLQPDAPVLAGVRPVYPWLGPLVLALSLALLVWAVWARLSESDSH